MTAGSERLIASRRCRPFRHTWRVARVSPPLWDISARGILKTCIRCGKVVAK